MGRTEGTSHAPVGVAEGDAHENLVQVLLRGCQPQGERRESVSGRQQSVSSAGARNRSQPRGATTEPWRSSPYLSHGRQLRPHLYDSPVLGERGVGVKVLLHVHVQVLKHQVQPVLVVHHVTQAVVGGWRGRREGSQPGGACPSTGTAWSRVLLEGLASARAGRFPAPRGQPDTRVAPARHSQAAKPRVASGRRSRLVRFAPPRGPGVYTAPSPPSTRVRRRLRAGGAGRTARC